ncbi:MAG TPA: cupin domain-containing protein [Candidatus Dormibacteraeota bacterium]|nr:cupin domain-containing protein [Candidatus Dormibacteraeota bacterium]
MSEPHVPGHTTATASREVRDYTAPTRVHNFEAEIQPLLAEARANKSHRAARTLSKNASLNAVLMAITGGAEIHDHSVHGSAVLQVLQGHIRVHLEEGELDLRAGEAISLASRVPHRLAAVEDTALLLVVVAG